jgi:uncharacterized membrane protein YhiD involved in acid resistance
LWGGAAIGVAAGVGMYFAVGVTAAVTIVGLWALRPVRERIRHVGEDPPGEGGDDEGGGEGRDS